MIDYNDDDDEYDDLLAVDDDYRTTIMGPILQDPPYGTPLWIHYCRTLITESPLRNSHYGTSILGPPTHYGTPIIGSREVILTRLHVRAGRDS